jgi:DNA-binding MarR family transcriptional regulator
MNPMGPLLKKKPSAVFIFLKSREQAYLSEIAKETGTSYVYVTGLVSSLEEKGLVSIHPERKKKMVKLTEKGKEVSTLLEELKRRME